MSLAKLFDIYQNNVFPGMLRILAEDLGVKVTSLQTLGVGFYPGHQAWVFAERNAKGDVIGLKYRYLNGKKYYEKGSKPGLTYTLNTETGCQDYISGRSQWVRVADAGVTCPICGKSDWCRVSPGNPENPSAVLCSRISEGATKIVSENNYLHIFDPKRNPVQGNASILSQSDLPILVVEGATDVLAATDLGFVSIGRPSAMGGLKILRQMPLTGRTVWIIGENDAGAGKEGMDKTFYALRDNVRTLVRVTPPATVKDLRAWVGQGLTREELIAYVEQHGKKGDDADPNIFDDDTAYPIAERFLGAEYTTDDISTLRKHKGQWLSWTGGCYANLEEDPLRGSVYRYLVGKQYIKSSVTGPALAPYKPSTSKVRDILDALNAWCPVDKDPPVWLRDGGTEPRNLIAFRNGLLNVEEYVKGNIVMHDPTPAYFSMCVIPYDFDPDKTSELWLPTLAEFFDGDEEVVQHLQEWFGYQLTADMSMERMMLFTGRTRSGKGTVLEAMAGMLGPQQCVPTSFQSLATEFGRVPLVGKLAAILGDAKTPRARDADVALEVILQIIGRDPIQIRPLYHQGYGAYLSTRFTVAMNGLPTFTDHARALAARTNIINFPNSYEGREDATIKTRLKKDAEDGKLIGWALEGLKCLRRRGRFERPQASLSSFRDMVSITSPTSTFVNDCCQVSDKSKAINVLMIYEAYQHWCGENGKKAGGKEMFIRNLLAECPSVTKNEVVTDGRKEYTCEGLTLQPWVYGKYLGRPD